MARKLKYNDEEGGMAKAQLQKIEMYAAKLNEMIHPEDELEGWVQNKLSVVAAYMGDVKHYLDYALQNEPEYKEFANGGMMDKPRYWEVEFTWDAADDESRKVNVMAESVSDAEEQVKKKFGPYYEGLKVVEIEEDKEITWEEYAKRPKKYETRSYSKEEMDEITRAQIKHDEEQLRREQGFADGGLTQDESDKLTKLQEEKDNLKMQELDISMGVKGGKKNWENKMRSINDEINTLLKKKYGWKMASGGFLDDLKNQGVKKEFIRQAFFAGGNNGSKAASGKDYDTYEQWLKKHNIKHHIIYKKAFEDGGKAGFNLMKGKDAETYEEWQKKIEKEWSGKMADGGMAEKYFIYKDQEKYLNQLKEGEIDSDDLEILLNNLFTDVHKVNRVNQSDFKEISKSEKELIIKTAIGWGIAEMVDGKVEFVERDDYDDEYASGGMMAKGGKMKAQKVWLVNVKLNGNDVRIMPISDEVFDKLKNNQKLKLEKLQETSARAYSLDEVYTIVDEFNYKQDYASGGMMKYEGSTEAEDFKEAEEYIGKDVWETLSKEDKLNATQYLKAKGVIGFYGQEEELADFMASQYAKGGSLYRGMRPSPSISATAYPRGFKMIGNDGNMWEISLDSRGVHRWTKSSSATRNDRTEQKAKIREAIELLESMRDEIDVEDEIATLKKLQ